MYHSHILSSKRLNKAQTQWIVRGRHEGALLHRSESQQWIRTPGSSCCWQCLDVAQPLVRRMPRAAGRTGQDRAGQKRETISQRRVTSCFLDQQEKKSTSKHRAVQVCNEETVWGDTPRDVSSPLKIPSSTMC